MKMPLCKQSVVVTFTGWVFSMRKAGVYGHLTGDPQWVMLLEVALETSGGLPGARGSGGRGVLQTTVSTTKNGLLYYGSRMDRVSSEAWDPLEPRAEASLPCLSCFLQAFNHGLLYLC